MRLPESFSEIIVFSLKFDYILGSLGVVLRTDIVYSRPVSLHRYRRQVWARLNEPTPGARTSPLPVLGGLV